MDKAPSAPYARAIGPILVGLLLLTACDGEPHEEASETMESTPAQEEWRRKTVAYADAINAYVATAHRVGWDRAGEEPAEPGRGHLVEEAIAAVRQANAQGLLEGLRDKWPPAHAPLIDLLEENGQDIPVVCVLDDGSIVARIGAPYETGKTVRIVDNEVTEVPEVGFFGRGPKRRYFGITRESGIEILDGWGGPRVSFCPWPTGQEGIPKGFAVPAWDDAPTPTGIVPFPDGRRVLMRCRRGVFVMTAEGAMRLLPTEDSLREYFELVRKDDPTGELTVDLAMEHGIVSSDGKLIAVGSQDSTHLVFDGALRLVGNIGHRSEYPHHAVFSADGRLIAFNSCHFYNGITVGVPTKLLPGLTSEPYEEDGRIPVIEEEARVYAAVARGDEIIMGDASGYVRSVSVRGERRWQQFVGSSVGALDLAADGKTLVVSTYAGFLAIFRLDAGIQAPHQIGTGSHLEERRWLFWRHEAKPLIW